MVIVMVMVGDIEGKSHVAFLGQKLRSSGMADITISMSDDLMAAIRFDLTMDWLQQMTTSAMHAINSDEADTWVTEWKSAENEDVVFIIRVHRHSPLLWYFSLESRPSAPEVTAGISIARPLSDRCF